MKVKGDYTKEEIDLIHDAIICTVIDNWSERKTHKCSDVCKEGYCIVPT